MSVIPMKLKEDDMVVLSPSFPHGESLAAPLWGGQYGYITGQVTKTVTHDHDRNNHVARVLWSNGEDNAIQEKYLVPATPDMLDLAKDMECKIPLDFDIGLLYWNGRSFHFAVIECSVGPTKTPLFSLMLTRHPIRSTAASDYGIVTQFLMSPDMEEMHFRSLPQAMQRFHEYWGLPNFKALPLPLTIPDSVRELSRTLFDTSTPALARFQMPVKVCDIAATANI